MQTIERDLAPAPSLAALRGRAAAAVADLGDRAVPCDLYDERGAQVYHDTGSLDGSEIRELSRLVRRGSGPVLELAAGSGRLTLPLLALGRPLTALELSASMIELLWSAAAGHRAEHALEVVRGDMADFDLGRRFGVVVLGASSISLLDAAGRRGLYAAVRRHLDDDGTLLLSVAETVDGDTVTDEQYDVRGRSGRRYRMHQYWAPGEPRRSVCVYPLDDPDDPAAEVSVCLSAPGVLPRRVVVDELAAAGLAVRAEHPVAARGHLAHDVILEVGHR